MGSTKTDIPNLSNDGLFDNIERTIKLQTPSTTAAVLRQKRGLEATKELRKRVAKLERSEVKYDELSERVHGKRFDALS